MARRTRVRIEKSPHEDDSDDGYEQEDTPRPNKIRKRLSESNNPDASFGADSEQGAGSGRPPLHAVNINDDAAEKRRRRKSTRNVLLDTSQNGPSSDANMDSETGLADTSRSRAQRPLNSVVPPPDIAVPLDVMTSNYEEWMKMATDNKITATNTWDFALIDYFHDMQLLRNVDDNSINFQRASCTLDGCVKIWTSRVDSVGAETGKLLSNLANDMREEEEDGDSDNPDGGPTSVGKRKKRARPTGSTLVKDPAQLRSKKMDLEFSVDPLFRKTCADFDEGGASGLLMNHLSLGTGEEGGLRVIFDASDSTGDKEDVELEPLPEMSMELSYLRATFLPDLAALDELEIAPSLADFSFDSAALPADESQLYQDDTQVNLDGFNEDDDSLHGGDGGTVMDVDGDNPPGPSTAQDFFNDQPLDDDYGGGGGGYYPGDEDGSLDPEERGGRPGPEVPFDPSRKPNERDLVMALAEPDADGGVLGYFDKNFMKNWAGPEHWKIRKPIRKADASNDKPKARREKKEAFKIDFLSPPTKSLKEITDELFKQAKPNAINLPTTAKKGKKSKEKEAKNDHRLPDDMHFTSRQLVTLFLKPKFALKMRGRTVAFNESGDGEVAQQFWAENAADQIAGRTGEEQDNDNDPAPFNTQFFNDDDDLPGGFDDGFDAEILTSNPSNEEQDLLAATQGQSTRRVKLETVKYTKRAKRVDVRKLKENIWKGLQIVVPDSDDPDDSMDVDEAKPDATDPKEARVFSSVIDDLQQAYPPEKMNDISTSFCFICLLHLANEQGLKLEREGLDGASEEEDVKVERQVGNLWNVKVYRDAEAGKIV